MTPVRDRGEVEPQDSPERLYLAFTTRTLYSPLGVMEMAEKGPAKGEEKAPKPKPDLIRDLWKEQARLKLHLLDGTVIEGRIKQFDQWNLQVLTDGKRYWIPKHAVVYAEI